MNSGRVKCTCGWSWNKSDSSKKDMYICHECGRDNSNNMKNGGWLDTYADGGTMQEHQENYNNSEVSLPEGFVGIGNNTKGRNYSPAWGGSFQMGGSVYPVNYVPEAQGGMSIPGAGGRFYARYEQGGDIDFSYPRTKGIPSNGPYAKKTKASAQNGESFVDKLIANSAKKKKKVNVRETNTVVNDNISNASQMAVKADEKLVKGIKYKKQKDAQDLKKWNALSKDEKERIIYNEQSKKTGTINEYNPDSNLSKFAQSAVTPFTALKDLYENGEVRDNLLASVANDPKSANPYDAAYLGALGYAAAPLIPATVNAVAPYTTMIGNSLATDAVIGGNTIAGLNLGNAITAGFATHGAMNIAPDVKGWLDKPSWEKAGEVGMDALEVLPAVGPTVKTLGEGFGYAGNKLKEARDLISANFADETAQFKEATKNVSEGVKQFGKNVKGIYSGERRANSDKIGQLYDDERGIFNADEYLKNQEDLFKLNKKESDLQWKLDREKSPWVTAKRNELNDKIKIKQARIDTANTLTLNNEGLVQSGKDTSLGLRTGSTDIVDLQTGTSTPISTAVPKEDIRFDLKGNEVVKTIDTKTAPEVTPEYISTVKKNIDFIENQIPGSKVFGSAKNVAETEVPHIIGDYDVLMSQTEYEKFAKNNPAIGTNGFAKVHDIPGAAKGIEPIDVNVIEETAGKATGTRAEELFRQVAPDDFYEAAKEAIKNKSKIKIPYSSQELVDMTNPTTKSVVDAYESSKSKHLNKIDALINYGKPDVVAQGQQQYVKSLVGSKGTIGPQFPVEQLSDVATNKTILDRINFIGNKKLVAADPQRMQIALNDYYINNSVLVRQVDKGSIDKIEAAIKEYHPEAGGGAANGIGQNHVTLGFPSHGWDNVTSVKQIGMNLDTSSPLTYLDDFEHQTSGSKIFSEEERNILSEIVDGMTDESFKRTGIDLRKRIGKDKEVIKGSKNSAELIERLPYSEEGKQALYDFARKTNRQMVRKDYNYGNSNFTATLRDFDEGLDAMKFTAMDQVEMNKVLKSYSDRSQAAESYSPKKIDQLLPKQFKGIKGYLEGGIERAEQRLAALKAERNEIVNYRDVASKVFNKKYKEEIERAKQYKDNMQKQIQEMQNMRQALVNRQMELQEFEKKFKVYLASSLGVTGVGLSIALNEQMKNRRGASGRIRKKDSEKPQPKPQQNYEKPLYGSPRKNGGIVDSDRGQWDYPGEITRIKGGNITMKKDPKTGKALTEPILGIANTGERKMMYPGQDYNFYDADYVTEIPKSKLAKNGLRQEQKGLVNLDQLTNFTNYNKPQPGGWLEAYK